MSIVNVRKGPGRPAVNAKPITVRLPPDQLAALDEWIERNNGELSRPEAIRLILKGALPDPNTTSVRREFDKAGSA